MSLQQADSRSSFKDPKELQDTKRFCNNYSIFSKLSRDFQEFILMILHPDPAHRIPSVDSVKIPPIAELFLKFPRLFGTCSNEEERNRIIENMTPSSTQAVLLQVMSVSTVL
jgi:hypothetical protein